MATINADLGDSPAEGAQVGDTLAVTQHHTAHLGGSAPLEGFSVTDFFDPDWDLVLLWSAYDTVVVNTSVQALKGNGAFATDGIGIGLTDQTWIGKAVREVLGLGAVFAPETTYRRTITEVAAIRDRMKAGLGISVDDVMQLGAAVVALLGLRARDGIGIGVDPTPTTLYRRGILDRLRARDYVTYSVGGAIAEAIGVAGTLQGDALFDQLLADTVGAGDSVTSVPLILQVVTEDGVEITATDTLQMLYDGRLSDTISLTAVYPSIGGSVTTWALNTKTGALTEYSDYAFNSFARLDGRHIAASSEGLYELTGDTDDGQDIIAEMESALVQMAGSRFTSFRAAYIAVRGGGQFVLRLETGDGKTYNYAVTADDMATTKINLGKGLRARYFSFTLISSGQDFDLESLEFVPIAARRRV